MPSKKELLNSLISKNDETSLRTIIREFEDSSWRETQLYILKNLYTFQSLRALEFLIQHATQNHDIPMSQIAIESLGKSKSIWSKCWLECYLNHVPDTICANLLLALNQTRSRFHLIEFINSQFENILENQNWLILESILTIIGDQKFFQFSRQLEFVLESKSIPERIQISALLSYGKIAKSNVFLKSLRKDDLDSGLWQQVFRQVSAQLNFRSQWTLEDYISKIFSDVPTHDLIAVELGAYPLSDVLTAISLYSDDQWKKFYWIFTTYPEILANNDYYQLCLNKISTSDQAIEFIKTLQFQLPSSTLYKDIQNLNQKFSLNINQNDTLYSILLYHQDNFSEDITNQELILTAILAKSSSQKFKNKWIKFFFEKIKTLSTESDKSRWVRSLSKLQPTTADLSPYWNQLKSESILESSLLQLIEQCPSLPTIGDWNEWIKNDDPEIARANLRALRSCTELPIETTKVLPRIKLFLNSNNRVLILESLKLLQKHLFNQAHLLILKSAHDFLNTDREIFLSCIVSLKSYPCSESLEFLGQTFLNSEDEVIQTRALDGLCDYQGPRALKFILEGALKWDLHQDVVEKISKSFTSLTQSAPLLFELVESVYKKYETTASKNLWNDFLLKFKENEILIKRQNKSIKVSASLEELNEKLSKEISIWHQLPDNVQSVLRSAEISFLAPETKDPTVDKSAQVVEFCKAVDLYLENTLGKKYLFPALEKRLHEFQNLIHILSLHEPWQNIHKILSYLNINFDLDLFPIHKASLLAQQINNGKILHDNFKSIDGLRAWAIMLLIFCRSKNSKIKAPVIFTHSTEESDISKIARELINLQDLRNPAAHRDTLQDLNALAEIRTRCFNLLKDLEKLLGRLPNEKN